MGRGDEQASRTSPGGISPPCRGTLADLGVGELATPSYAGGEVSEAGDWEEAGRKAAGAGNMLWEADEGKILTQGVGPPRRARTQAVRRRKYFIIII